jgi:hypothetical protein
MIFLPMLCLVYACCMVVVACSDTRVCALALLRVAPCRLRTRLVKLGCIIAEPGMLGDKAISVLRLVKPFKLQVPVVVDSDVDGDREAAGDMDDDGGDGDAGDDAADEAAGGEGGAAGGGARKMLTEVCRDQLLLEMICEVSCWLVIHRLMCTAEQCCVSLVSADVPSVVSDAAGLLFAVRCCHLKGAGCALS